MTAPLRKNKFAGPALCAGPVNSDGYPQVSGPTSPIRESWSCLPAWLQPWLTDVSGKPLVREKPGTRTPIGELLSASGAILAGVLIGGLAASSGGWAWLLVPFAWLLVVHGIRKNDLGPFHEAAHGVFARNKELNNAVGEIHGVVHFGQNFRSYGPEHRLDHHGKPFATLDDPTFRFLILTLGLRPGMSLREAWSQLLGRLLSPTFHLGVIVNRLRSWYRGASFVHWVLVVLYAESLGIVVYFAGWVPVLVGWVIPLLIVNLAITIRMCVEHVFPPANTEGMSVREVSAACTHTPHFGAMAPSPELPPWRRKLAWAGWWLRMLFYEWPARLLICPGEAISHAVHHRRPKDEKWADYINNLQEELSSPNPTWGVPYTEVWSLHNQINACFRSLRDADPEAFDPRNA